MGILISVEGLFSAADSYGSTTATLEIICMLLVAFILGYLLRFFIKRGSTSEDSEWEAKYKKAYEELQECKQSRVSMTASAPSFASSAPVVDPDDLKKVEGIGPKIEELLNAAQIHTWKQLSRSTPEFIKEILNAAGPRFTVHNPTSWPEQAKMADEGKWDELKIWQDELKGGK